MVIWLLLGLALLMYMAYKGIPIIITTIFCSLFIVALSGMPFLESITGPYMAGMAGYFQKFFLVFLFGAIFGKIIEITGGAESVARSVIKTFGDKYIVISIVVATALLTYGGVNLFVALFAIYPLAMSLFEQANIPRRIFPAAYASGAATFSMTGPFTPAIQNLVPTKYLGTDATACAIPGTIVSIFMFVAVVYWLQRQVKVAAAAGENFKKLDTDIQVEDKILPQPWLVAIPMAAVLIVLNVFKKDVVIALGTGIILGVICLFKFLPSIKEILDHVQKATSNATNSIANTCAAVGFGTVVAASPGFAVATKVLTGLGGGSGSLVAAGVMTMALAGISGSASGGLGIAVPIVAEHFLPLGVNPEALHRVVAIACGVLDSLPHNGFVVTMLTFTGLTHKEGYKDLFVTTVIIPLVALILLYVLLYIIPGWV